MNVGAVIVCAGEGKRLGKIDKASLMLKGKPLLYYILEKFRAIGQIKEIVIVLKPKHFKLTKGTIKDKKIKLVKGGEERKDSVYNGVTSLSRDIDYVLVHDGARPFVSKKVITNILKELKKYPAVICGCYAKDTVKIIDKNFVKKTIERDKVFLTQTPQGFRKDLIVKAYKKFKNRNLTDDAQYLELMGQKVKIIEASPLNFKITYPEDIVFAKLIADEKL